MRIVLLLALIALSGCGDQRPGLDPAFQPYAERFIQDAAQNNKTIALESLSIQFMENASTAPLLF